MRVNTGKEREARKGRQARERSRPTKALAQRSLTITKPSKIMVVRCDRGRCTAQKGPPPPSRCTTARPARCACPDRDHRQGRARRPFQRTHARPRRRARVRAAARAGTRATSWVDDQVTPVQQPASVSAKVGEGEPAPGRFRELAVVGAHLAEGAAEGSVVNHSSVGQHELVVYAIARRGGDDRRGRPGRAPRSRRDRALPRVPHRRPQSAR